MTLAVTYSRSHAGMECRQVVVEVHISNGIPRFNIVGLPETAVKESKERVRSAILSSGYKFPSGRHVTINLAPADLPKMGGQFDLPIAIGMLAATQQIPSQDLPLYEFASELALTGGLRPCKGILPIALASYRSGRYLVVSTENADEASLVSGLSVFVAGHLNEVCAHLQGKNRLIPRVGELVCTQIRNAPDLKDVCGQIAARKALEIAAAGKHGLLLIGPPGTGKTMLANRMIGLLSPLSQSEAIETAAIASLHHPFSIENWGKRPFRSPHHSISDVAMVGGGNPPKPGEISLAHHGILFLDELPEFKRQTLEGLREPMETGQIAIARAKQHVIYPANFQLIATMNPCPCGHYGNPQKTCRCTSDQILRYCHKISGPFMDRIDLSVLVPMVEPNDIQSAASREDSATVRERVLKAQHVQYARKQCLNGALTGNDLNDLCEVPEKIKHSFFQTLRKLGMSMRAYHRILRVARTIADLEQQTNIEQRHLHEALMYRYMDRTDASPYE